MCSLNDLNNLINSPLINIHSAVVLTKGLLVNRVKGFYLELQSHFTTFLMNVLLWPMRCSSKETLKILVRHHRQAKFKVCKIEEESSRDCDGGRRTLSGRRHQSNFLVCQLMGRTGPGKIGISILINFWFSSSLTALGWEQYCAHLFGTIQ